MSDAEVQTSRSESETTDKAVECSQVESSQGVKVATFYQWKYSHYFKVMDESEKNMRAHCSLCSPSSKPLSCARNTTSNFKKHLDTVLTLVAVIPEGSKGKRPTEGEVPRNSKRQATLQARAVSPAAIRGLVAQYIVDDMLPLSTVESPMHFLLHLYSYQTESHCLLIWKRLLNR